MPTAEMPLLIITGTVGVGKSAVLSEIHAVLREAHCSHACMDVDALGLSYPQRGPFNRATVLENVRTVWTNFRAAGAERLVVAAVVENPADVTAIRDAVLGARATVCLLLASESTRLRRLQAREIGSELAWHVRRTSELQDVLDHADVHDFAIENDNRPLVEVAREIVLRAGWSLHHERRD